MLKWLSILVSVIFLFTAPAFAQDSTYEVYRLPEGQKVVSVDDGDTYMGYTLGQFNKLLVMDNDLRLAEGVVEHQGNILEAQTKQLVYMDKALGFAESNTELLTKDRDRVTKMWKADNKEKHKAQNKPFINVNSWLIGAAVVETIAIIVLIGMM